jgi:oligoendopeptidase F
MALFALTLGITTSSASSPEKGSEKAAAGAGGGEEAGTAIPERKDVPDKFKWHTTDIFESDAEWEKAFEKLKGAMPRIASFKGKLGKSAKNLLECYTFQDEISEKIEHVFAYASLNKDTDTRVTKYQDMYNQIYALAVEFSAAAAYITPEILSVPEETIRSFIAEEKGLKVYEHALNDLMRQRAHILSEKEENLIAGAGNVFRGASDAFTMLTNADLTFPTIEDEEGKEVKTSNSLYYMFRGSRDRAVRKANEEAYHGRYREFRNTLASLMRTNVYKAMFNAKVRGYESTLHAALDGANIPVEVYMNLVNSVNDNLAPLHRYAKLRKKILGVDELHGYDLYNTLFPDADMKVTFDEAKELVAVGLEPLGEDYLGTMMKGIESGWIDVYENEGKRSGAYSAGIYGVHPFVLLNYHDRLEDAFTLAHELGHSMHSWHSQKHQPKVYADYTIFNAEVASTTNEALLVNHLLEVTKDREQKLFLLDFYIDSIRNTFYRQTLFAEFEMTIHKAAEEGKSLTADYLEETYGGLVKKYYGPAFTLDEYKSAEWSRIPHFYRDFYVYCYATGYSAAAAFAKRIQEQGDVARDLYVEHFLSGGSSDYSTVLLKKAGVDMTTPEPIVALSELFDRLIDEMEKLIEE